MLFEKQQSQAPFSGFFGPVLSGRLCRFVAIPCKARAPLAIRGEIRLCVEETKKMCLGYIKAKRICFRLVDKAISWPIDWRHSIDLHSHLVWLRACGF